MEILNIMQNRKSIRTYAERPILSAQLDCILQAAEVNVRRILGLPERSRVVGFLALGVIPDAHSDKE